MKKKKELDVYVDIQIEQKYMDKAVELGFFTKETFYKITEKGIKCLEDGVDFEKRTDKKTGYVAHKKL